jgi:hypothetical protein
MGKLHVWMGDHRKDPSEKLRVGGFVSIEDLEGKSNRPSPSKSVKKVCTSCSALCGALNSLLLCHHSPALAHSSSEGSSTSLGEENILATATKRRGPLRHSNSPRCPGCFPLLQHTSQCPSRPSCQHRPATVLHQLRESYNDALTAKHSRSGICVRPSSFQDSTRTVCVPSPTIAVVGQASSIDNRL